jgi:hypothetical protein
MGLSEITKRLEAAQSTLESLWTYWMDVVRTPPAPENKIPRMEMKGPVVGTFKEGRLERKVSAEPGDSTLNPSLRRVLTALAQHSPVATVDRLAALAGYTVNGHFNNMLGDLRSRGWMTPARQLPMEITDAGLKALGSYEPLPTGEELRQYWLNKLSPSEGKLMKSLFEFYPNGVNTAELAEEAGYTVNGHFNNMLGRLRTMGLITPARQPIKAMEYLMEE